ncbi:response regulator [Vallitalea okinawensis]|uniref:response regulator n=1 Tax=Vallitalea okinawensis TaxID=2078660 RepID=UPI001478C138|nr:response regulator [Vallitalea okinawensis]
MYKILIVDDERVVRLALHNMIEWEEMGVELIGEAKDGLEALKMIEEYGAHIIITDLKMPNMDGIQLIQELKKQQFTGKILVLSNYDDFKLVKKAMQLGVIDYILKVTMKVHDLKEAITKVIQLLDEDKEKKAKSIDNKIQARRGEKLYREKMVRSILHEEPQCPIQFHQFLQDLSIHVQMESNLMFYIQIDALAGAIHSQKIKDIQLLSFSIKNIISEIIHRRTVGEIVDLSPKEFVLITPSDAIDDPLSLAKRIAYMLNMYINLSVSIVIAKGKGMELHRILKESQKYISCKFYHGPSNILYLNDSSIDFELDVDYEKLLRSIRGRVYNKEWAQVYQIFVSMMERGKKENIYPVIIKNVCLVLLDHIVNVQKDPSLWRYEKLEEELHHVEFMDEYSNKIKELLNKLEQQSYKKIDNQDSVIEQVEQYILGNMNKKITLKKLAEYVHLNPSYLSRLFKQIKGVSLIDYSNQLKIDKAKEILQQEDISIQQVGRAIGIQDPYYFNKVFKKYVGISPSVYKKAWGQK